MLVKVNSERNSRVIFPVTEEDLSRALSQLTMPHVGEAVITVDELHSMLGIGQSTTYTYVTTGRLPAHLYTSIAHAAFAAGDTSLVELLMPEGYTLQPLLHGELDGDVKDNECQIISQIDEARVAAEKGDVKRARRATHQARHEMNTFEAEIEGATIKHAKRKRDR